MAEFRISRIRYTWRNTWATTTTYNRDDVIRYGGSTWICQRQHTASTFAADQTYLANPGDSAPTPAWLKMTDGYAWRGPWTTTPTLYNPGDIALHGGVIYLCVTSHTSTSTFDANIANWAVYLSADNWRSAWAPATRYGIGDVVRYNGVVYRCIVGHTSSTTALGLEIGNNDAEDDSTGELWQVYYEGIQYVAGGWTAGTRYRPNDLVKYGGSVLRCVTGHVAQANITNANFVTEFPGQNFYDSWLNTVYYAVGDIVRHGGYLYVAAVNNYASVSPSQDSTNWTLLSKAVNFVGTWDAAVDYKTGDVVRRGGNLYVATADTTSDGSSLDYLDAGNWEVVTTAQNYRSSWTIDNTYSVNDIVVYLGNTYSCNFEHVATDQNLPGDNGSGFFYWDIVLQAGQQSGMSQRGDLLTFDLSRTLQGDGSSFGPAAVPVGEENQLVIINEQNSVDYAFWGDLARVRYVSLDGVDDNTDPERGTSSFLPFRTVRYACEQVDDGFTGNTTVRVAVGEYEEITPIIVPRNTVVLGAELRSTTIKAAGPIAALALDSTYTIAVLNRISGLVSNVVRGLSVVKTTGNTQDPVIPFTSLTVNNSFDPPQYTLVPTVPPSFDGFGQELLTQGAEIFASTTTTVVPLTGFDTDAIARIVANINNMISYINFFVNSTGTNPVVSGTNSISITADVLNVATALEQNKEFFAAEAVAYMQATYSAYNFDSELCKRDVRRYIDALKYDTSYTGNYKSVLAARYYRNAVLGCNNTEDMFYVRNGTGIRNCTLKGLESTLNPPSGFDLYQLPLGGAYVSLDPGWGPADTRTWIDTRSPYIQGVTTIGTGCVGQKVDGSLHNGGNRSIVSNDFTQVLSDGIGAWVLNNARAELVSVFSYYAHIGYLAQDGGVIRATNGNSSYGTYGVIADGIDATETPVIARNYTRAQQAIVAAAFAGDFVDEIQILEWSNAGQDYSNLTAAFVGAGIDAEVVFEDFRDDAVFEARITDANAGTAQIAQAIGGGGYTLVQNNAQTGGATTITIATNDANSITEYLGMRIILTSGAGTGQYGYIAAYNNISKVVTVYRESDDQPGWDHVVPGKPLTIPLLTNTTYRIEPRVIFSAPQYLAQAITVATNTTWSEIIYGDTTETYNNVAVNEAGTGTTIGVVSALATFNVVKQGRDYTITVNNAGAGYQTGQLLTIDGDLIGGATPLNDLLIVITDVSDDSTNSILAAQQKTYGTGEDNEAASGRFVVVSSAGSAALYSEDGVDWTDFNMPTSGNWKCLAAGRVKYPSLGNHLFVAIRKGSSVAASSTDGINWATRSMPASREWNSCIYGGGLFIAVATDSNSAAYSLSGLSWSTVTLPTFGDSTLNEWVDVAYGKNRYVALANSGNTVAVGTYNSTLNTWSWVGGIMDVVADSSAKDWISIAYGNDRFVAISSTGDIGYSFDGAIWLPATMPSQDGSTGHNWKKIRYAQGVFFAVGDTGGRDIAADPVPVPSTYAAQSADGIVWTTRTLATSAEWVSVAFGNPYTDARDSTVGKSTPMWVAIDNTNKFNKIQTGARALGRVTLSSGIIRSVKLWDPGSGYTEGPTCTLVDPNNGTDARIESRTADAVIGSTSWIDRGLGYRTLSTTVTVTGNGFADVVPSGKFIVINDLPSYPGPGANLVIEGLTGSYTLVAIQEIGLTDRGLAARIRISPEIKVRDNLAHLAQVTIRTQFSQARITGHDYLDVGTGNFEETNYPELYSGFYEPAPENEVVELDRGRVFYTSTDQSGNFRTGELFAVEQATGVVTISSDFFDLSGLSELRLGGIRVGGTGAVVREFSTDTLFTADSNNIVPTQRAIAAYLAGRLSVGGSEIAVGSFIAGTILVGPDRFNSTAGLRIIIPVLAEFDGPNSGISGSILAQAMFYKSFR
jgi:hypothetical protein